MAEFKRRKLNRGFSTIDRLGGKHQELVQGILDSLTTQEVIESTTSEAHLEDLMQKQSRTGVIYATTRARQFGFKGAGDPAWGNLGQGAPETGVLENQPHREFNVECSEETNEYSSVNGREDLRTAVANYYNHWFRQGKKSQYTAENVAICGGGRSGLCRLMASLSNLNVGYFLPEYTAYTQLLGEFEGISPIPVAHDLDKLQTSPKTLEKNIKLHGMGGFLFSNPSNPTGVALEGETLSGYVDVARRNQCLMIFDEFYNHYMYEEKIAGDTRPFHTFSASEFVEDVNTDPVCLVGGLTKNWRLPGWRCCWVIGPKHCIDVLGSVGSFVDGGANNPLQKAAIPFLQPDFVKNDALALQAHFRKKRDYMIENLHAMGIKARKPDATFYIWADVSSLPAPINNGVVFFEYCIREQVICVPGIFFDINPFHRRKFSKSPYINYLRMSFGPAWPNLKMAIAGIGRVIEMAKNETLKPL